MEYIYPILGAVIGASLGVTISQWLVWRNRAVSAVQEARHWKASIDGMQLQLNTIADERQLHHDTIQETFDWIEENRPFGSHDIEIMALRNKLMDVLSNSSVGRV